MYACADADRLTPYLLWHSTRFSADRYLSLPLVQPWFGPCSFCRARRTRTACKFDGRRGARRGAREASRGSTSRTPSTTGHLPRQEVPRAARARAEARRSCLSGAARPLAAGASATHQEGGRLRRASPLPRRRWQSEGSPRNAQLLRTRTA